MYHGLRVVEPDELRYQAACIKDVPPNCIVDYFRNWLYRIGYLID